MIATLFLIIAYLRRKQFLSNITSTRGKAAYYVLNVAFTPIFGPFFFRLLYESKWVNNPKEEGENACLPPDMLNSMV